MQNLPDKTSQYMRKREKEISSYLSIYPTSSINMSKFIYIYIYSDTVTLLRLPNNLEINELFGDFKVPSSKFPRIKMYQFEESIKGHINKRISIGYRQSHNL